MITKISLQNFKSWENTGEIRLSPITALFGSNSSGKTALLQSLLMLKQTTESPDRAQVLNLGDERSLIQLGSFRDIIFSHNTEAVLKFDLNWKQEDELKIDDPEHKGKTLFQGDEFSFTTEIEGGSSGRILINKIAYKFASNNFSMKRKQQKNQYVLSAEPFKLIRNLGRAWDLPAPMKCYGFPDQVKAYFQNAGFLSDFELAFEKLFSRVYYLGPLREYPKRQYIWAGAQPGDMGRKGEKVIDALLASGERKAISRGKGLKRFTVQEYVAYWLSELNMIHDFSVEQIAKDSNLYQVWVKRQPNSARVLITDVGFGVSQILPVLTLCYYVPEGSTILMEQPEIHLHPTVQAGLADVFIDAIKTRKVQIIIESHSEHLLRRLQRRIAEEKITNHDAALYFCEMKDGASHLNSLRLDLFGNITNWPKDFFGDEFSELASMTRAIQYRKMRETR